MSRVHVHSTSSRSVSSGALHRPHNVVPPQSLQLPFPANPWCKYMVLLVGPDLRPANPADYLTPEMSTPIFPCTDHPSSRPSVRPEPSFPFTNCYHWSGCDMEKKVRVKTRDYTEYDEGKVTQLPGIEHVEMGEFLTADLTRSTHAMRAARAGQQRNSPLSHSSGPEAQEPATSLSSIQGVNDLPAGSEANVSTECASVASESCQLKGSVDTIEECIDCMRYVP